MAPKPIYLVRCHFGFKDICVPKENNCGKWLILFVIVLFIGEDG